VRWLVVILAGCSFNARSGQTDGDGDGPTLPIDSSPLDVQPDSGSPGSGSGSSGSGSGTTIIGVQSSTSYGSGTTVLLILLPKPIAAGDACVLGVGAQGGTVTSVTDSSGDMFASIDSAGGQAVYVATDMAAFASDMITVTFSTTVGFTYAVEIYRGLATASLVDVNVISNGDSDMPDSGTATTTHAHDLLVGIASSDGAMAAGSGYGSRVAGTYSLIEDRDVTSTGTYHATATSGGSIEWSMAMLALEAAE
jgi:hypothetical protein